MTRKIRIAVIGVGYLGSYHTEKYAKIPEVNLVGIVDVRADRAKHIADQYGIAHFTDVKDILNKVDAVSVVVPTDAHYAVTKMCLEAGLDVLVEKPLTEKVWQAEELLKLAKQKDRILQVGHLERFNPAVKRARQYLKQPLFIECHRLNSFVERCTDVNVVLDLMIHDLDILLNFVPSRVINIDAVGTPVVSSTIDIANVRLRFQNGCVANLTASRISFKPMRKMRVFQPDAYLSLDFYHSTIEIYRRISENKSALPEIKGERFSLGKEDALAEEVQSFVTAVQHRTRPVVTAESAFEALWLADQIVEQMKRTANTYFPTLAKNLPAFRA